MKSINTDLIAYVESDIIPRYDSFDKAHNRQHVLTVISESLELAKNIDGIDLNMVYAIAAYHDTGLCRDRKTHHIVSGEIIQTDTTLRRWFSEEEIAIMKEAAEDHRASADHEPRSIYGRIVAEADRIIDTSTVLRRTVQFGLKHYPELGKEQQYERFVEHLNEKYAPGGYMKLWFPESKNALQLRKLQSVICNKEQLRSLFENIYKEESSTPTP
jgi:uncharacterized protein